MEISVIGSSQVNLGRAVDVGFCDFSKNPSSKIFNLKNNSNTTNLFQIPSLKWESKSSTGLRVKASATAKTEAAVISERSSIDSRIKPTNGVKLYVGLPLDAVSGCNTVNHARAIAAGLKALKLLGIDGVELPIWWGIVEKEESEKYDWTSYLDLAEMVQKLGLKLHVALCFHASKDAKIPLPEWVSRIGESEPDIYFTDRSGQRYKDCLSLAVDDVPILDGKTPVEAYTKFFESFKSSFSPFIGSTITGISIGLGPDGELRYPSHQHLSATASHCGAGEFQCYDKYILQNLKQHAEAHGLPLWGLGGPHDAPTYNQPPLSATFLSEHRGSWELPYGDFFLSWYSSQLISHADRILSVATSTFQDAGIVVSCKIPLMSSWYKTRSHPSELMAGFYNTANRDGYDSIAEIFGRYSCKIILPGIDLSDESQPDEARSSPELLLSQIASSCSKHGVQISGENSLLSGSAKGFEQIKKNLVGCNVVGSITFQRMGADFFAPENFPLYANFVRSVNWASFHPDDLVTEEEEVVESRPPELRTQAA